MKPNKQKYPSVFRIAVVLVAGLMLSAVSSVYSGLFGHSSAYAQIVDQVDEDDRLVTGLWRKITQTGRNGQEERRVLATAKLIRTQNTSVPVMQGCARINMPFRRVRVIKPTNGSRKHRFPVPKLVPFHGMNP